MALTKKYWEVSKVDVINRVPILSKLSDCIVTVFSLQQSELSSCLHSQCLPNSMSYKVIAVSSPQR
jgi:hypothetical protein